MTSKETLDYIVKLEVNNIKNIVFPTHNGKGVYIKVPLGNTEIFNKHNWKLDSAGIYEKFNKNIGSPFVIRKFKDGKFVHPVASFTDIDANYRYQEQFNVGELAYVYDKPDQNGTWYGLYYTEDQPTVTKLQNYTESYEKGELPLEYSIELWHDGNSRNIKDFEVVHGALVDNPAWNGSYVKGVCSGDMGQCKGALAAASMNHDCDSKCDCPICKLNLDNSYQLSLASKNSDMSSQESQQTNTKTETKKEEQTSNNNDNSPLGNITELFSKKIDEGFNNLKKEVSKDNNAIQQDKEKEKEVTKETTKKEEKKELIQAEPIDFTKIDISNHPKFKELDERLQQSEKRQRETEIGEMLLNYEEFFKHKNEGKEVDEDLFNETLKFYTGTKLSVEDVGKIAKNSFEIAKKHYQIVKNPNKQQQKQQSTEKEPEIVKKTDNKEISVASMKTDYEYNAALKQEEEVDTKDELLPRYKQKYGSESLVNNRNII